MMNRLTRKSNREYFYTHIFSTYENYTYEQFLKDRPYTLHHIHSIEYETKLGKLEDLEEELGCPLEVVFKSLKDGIFCVDYDNQEIRKFKVPLCFNSTSKQFYWSGNNIGYPDLKDYQKTWWLKGEKENE